MLDLTPLLNGLPRIRLEPFDIAYLDVETDEAHPPGIDRCITLIEPPASLRVPCIQPQRALTTLLWISGHAPNEAADRSRDALARMAAELPDIPWIHGLYVWQPDADVQVPAPEFIGWLRHERQRVGRDAGRLALDAAGYRRHAFEAGLVPLHLLDQLERVTDAVTHAPIFWDASNPSARCALTQLPPLPTPAAMIEMLGEVPWADLDAARKPIVGDAPFGRWRESVRPAVRRLEAVLGQPVYAFGDPDDQDYDSFDDVCHRFLLLHWCCTRAPDSSYVRYLMSLAGAPDVASLKAALVAPENYRQPFRLDNWGNTDSPVVRSYRLRRDALRKRVTLVFGTPYARATAPALLRKLAGHEVLLIAPAALTPKDWVARTTCECEDVVLQYFVSPVFDGALEVLALTDALYVIADRPPPEDGSDLTLRAGIDDLPELRLDNDFGSTGLWYARGQCIPYGCLDLPFPLVRRIAAWQRAYDRTVAPPYDMGEPVWWDAHEREAIAIARELQAAVGPRTVVKVWANGGFRAIDEVAR